jgi:pimeloyl-ACP methyl ester carboxylesterase
MATTAECSHGSRTEVTSDGELEWRFAAFLAGHPTRSFDLGGVRWTYRPAGSGAEGLVLLPGAAGGGEAYFLLAGELSERFRIVMIEYPPVSGLDEILRGLAEILGREGIERTALLGGSFGGMLAQAFLLRFPDRASRVVLSATAPPSAERAPRNERWLRRVRWIPMGLFRGLMRLLIRKLTRGVTIGRAFWRRFYLQAVATWSREHIESQYRVSIDFEPKEVAAEP